MCFKEKEITLRKSDHFRMHVIYTYTMLFDVGALGRVKNTNKICMFVKHKCP